MLLWQAVASEAPPVHVKHQPAGASVNSNETKEKKNMYVPDVLRDFRMWSVLFWYCSWNFYSSFPSKVIIFVSFFFLCCLRQLALSFHLFYFSKDMKRVVFAYVVMGEVLATESVRWKQMCSLLFRSLIHLQVTRWKQKRTMFSPSGFLLYIRLWSHCSLIKLGAVMQVSEYTLELEINTVGQSQARILQLGK